jgi:23S rRNA (adenine2503-C2)-methyltransferase
MTPAAVDAAESCGAWALTPEQLDKALAHASGAHAFAELQRPWRWQQGCPALSERIRGALEPLGVELPRVVTKRASADGSHKLLLELPGDGASVEVVHMPRNVGNGRVTLCVSSQVGCALGCSFCATAALGLARNLTAGEIVALVLVAMSELGPRHPGELTLVFMGMGEPLHNFSNVTRALEVLTDVRGLGLSSRRITISTAGLVPRIEALAEFSPRPLLAVSVNATTNELRDELMPINRRYPLEALQATLARYPWRPRERLTLEYVLLAGVNDGPDDARRLSDFGRPFPHQFNLIPYNAHPSARFRAPTEPELERFVRALLAQRPALVTVRRSRGRDIDAACGQLAQRSLRRLPLVEAASAGGK